MDRRSWLWRRKSSEKSPGETESSRSFSSFSERFSDDHVCPAHIFQSPEVKSKAVPADEVNDNVKTLSEKLSAALLNISSKEDLLNQHAKVAEEAVSGWEKAEIEVLSLKQQLEFSAQKNSALEDRVGHLDGALKECVRQLRQAREEQEQRIHEIIAKKTREWESTKSELENKLVNLQKELQTTKREAAFSVDLDLRSKLEASEKENSALKLELLSRVEELELRTIERDLSTKAAETASKQHLESIKKLTKLEAECCRLKAATCKAFPSSEKKSFTASSFYLESLTDSQSEKAERLLACEIENNKICGLETNDFGANRSDSWESALVTELDQCKTEKALGRNLVVPSVEINLMDDFLEMERLAALPDAGSGSFFLEVGTASDQPHADGSSTKGELEFMIHRTAELESKLEKMEAKNAELEMAMNESRWSLETSKNQLKEAELKLEELETQLAFANKLKQVFEVEMNAANEAREMAESQLRVVEAEMKTQLSLANKSREALVEEVKSTTAKKEVAESQLRAVEAEMKILHSKVVSLEEEVQKECALAKENFANFQKSKDELLKMKHEAELREAKLQHLASSDEELKTKQEKELAVAANKFAECQKTIASLGQQLRSLASLDGFLIVSEKPMKHASEVKDGGESWNLHPCACTLVT